MHKLGWKSQLFKSADISMLGHGCGVSKYPQFYDKIKKIYQMLPRPYVGRYSGEKGCQFFPTTMYSCIRKPVEIFITVSISDMLTIKYWQSLGIFMETAKDNIPKKFSVGDTYFSSLTTIGGNLFTRHPKK